MSTSLLEYIKKGKLYRRFSDKYVSPKGFMPWNKIVVAFAAIGDIKLLEQVNARQRGQNMQPMSDCAYGTYMAAALDAPAIYVERNLAEATLHTDVSAMERPNKVLPAFFICLPRGLLYDDDGLEISSLLVVENASFLVAGSKLSGMPKELADKLWDDAKDTGQLGDLRIFAVNEFGAVITAPTSWGTSTTVETEYLSDMDYPALKDDEQKQRDFLVTLSKIRRVVKNVILIYNYQKNLVSEVSVSVGTGFYKKRLDKTRSPLPTTLLGQNFLIRHTRTVSAGKDTKTHKRPHWRKGHWHTVLTGAGRKERRLRWFQPVYVNLTLDT
jgi:hypothetical protein